MYDFHMSRLCRGSCEETAAISSKLGAAIFTSQHTRRGGVHHWADQIVPIEFARDERGVDPFEPYDLECITEEAEDSQRDSLNHVLDAAGLLFSAQHRVFVFMLFVFGRKFRLLRLDRAGIITTPPIDYYENHSVLCDFLWRVARLDETALGFDPSATRVFPNDADYLRMDASARHNPSDADHTERDLEDGELEEPFVFEYVRSLFRASLATDWPRWKLQVSSGYGTREYLVGKPVFMAENVSGRGTRGYVAFDCHTHDFVWLKDAWRLSYMTVDKEGDILRRLNDVGIKGVPTLVYHGDVRSQTTVTGEWWELKSQHLFSTSPSTSNSVVFSHRFYLHSIAE